MLRNLTVRDRLGKFLGVKIERISRRELQVRIGVIGERTVEQLAADKRALRRKGNLLQLCVLHGVQTVLPQRANVRRLGVGERVIEGVVAHMDQRDVLRKRQEHLLAAAVQTDRKHLPLLLHFFDIIDNVAVCQKLTVVCRLGDDGVVVGDLVSEADAAAAGENILFACADKTVAGDKSGGVEFRQGCLIGGGVIIVGFGAVAGHQHIFILGAVKGEGDSFV